MAPLLRVDCVTVNSRDPWALAGFWAALVGGTPRDAGNRFVLVDPGEGRTRLLFQQADEAAAAPGWIHLDCRTADREATIAEVERLGGRLVDRRSDSHGDWVVLADPDGNPFCC